MLLLAQYTEENGIGLGKIFDKVKINAEDYSDVIEKITKTSLGDVLDGDRISVEKLSKAIGTSDSVIIGYAQTLKDTDGNIDLTTASTEGLSEYLKKTGNSFNFAAIKATLLNTALNAGIFLAVSLAIQGIAKALDNYINRVEKARERTDELFDEFKSMNDTLADHKKVVGELADRYDELSKGVNLSNNENLSLSTDEYEEFLDINEQLANSFPELAKGIDENGNSILTLGANGITAKEQLEELLQTEEDLNNFRIAQGLEEAFEGVYTYVEEANEATEKLNGSISDSSEAMSKLQDIAENGIKLTGENGQFIFAGNTNNQAELDYMNSLTASVNEFWKSLDGSRRVELGIDPSDLFTQNFDEYTGAFEVYANLYNLTPDELTALENIIQDNVGDTSGALLDSISDQSQKLQEQIQRGENAWRDFIPNLVAGMKSKQTFKNLDSDLQDIAVQIVEGLDYSYASVMEEYDPDLYSYIRDKFIVPMGNLNDSDKQKLQSSFEELFKLDAENISQSNQAEIEKLITTIATLLEKDPLEIRVALGFDIEDVQDRYNEALKEAKRQLGGFKHDDRGFEANNSVGDKLDDFWNENVVTEEDWVLWKKVTEGITDATEAMNAYTEAKKNANAIVVDETPVSLSIFQTIDQLNTQLKPAFDSLKSAYQDIFTDDGFTLENVDTSMLSSIKSTIDELNNMEDVDIHVDYSTFEDLAKVLTDSSSTAQDVQNAFNNFASTILDSVNPAISQCDGESYKLLQTLLESMGIVNAEEVLMAELGYSYEEYANAKEAAANSSIDLNNSIDEVATALQNEGLMATEDAQQIMNYMLAKMSASGATIDVSSTIGQFAEEYGWLADLIDQWGLYYSVSQKGSGQGNVKGSKNLGVGNYTPTQTTKVKQKVEIEPVFDGNKANRAAKSAGSKAGKSFKDALKEELSDLDSVISGITGKIDDQISSVNSEKEAVLSSIDEQKEAIEAAKEQALEAIEQERQARLDAIEEQRKALELQIKEKQKIIDSIQDEIKAMQDANEERKREIDLQKAKYELERMQNQRTKLVYSESKGMHYENDSQGIFDAKEQVRQIELEIEIANKEKQIDLIEKEIDLLENKLDILDEEEDRVNEFYDNLSKQTEAYYDQQLKALEKQRKETESYFESVIKNLETSKSKYQELTEILEKAELSAKLKQLGIDEEALLNGSEEEFEKLKNAYMDIVFKLNEGNDEVLNSLRELSGYDGTAPTVLEESNDKLGTMNGELGEATRTVDNVNSSLSETASTTDTVATNVGTVVDGLNQMPDSEKVSGLSKEFETLAENIGKVAKALGIGEGEAVSTLFKAMNSLNDITLGNEGEGIIGQFTLLKNAITDVIETIGSSEAQTVGSLMSAIAQLNSISLDESIIAQFTNLKEAIDSVTAAISGGGESAEGDGSSSGSGSKGGKSDGKGSEGKGKGESGGSGNSLTGAIKEMGETAKEVIGEADAEGDGTVIGEFGSLETAVNDVTTAIGGGDSEGGESSGSSGSENDGNLIDSIVDLGETTEKILGEPGGDGAIGKFEQFKEPIQEADEHVHSISDGLDAIDGKEVECTIKINVETSGGGIPGVIGAGMNLGSAQYEAKYLGNAHAEGTALASGNWAVQTDEKEALLGEVGYEIIVRNGRFFTVGNAGPEMFPIQKGDIVFNHEQSVELLKHGHTSGRGKAYADGTVGGGKFLTPDGHILRPLQEGDYGYDLMQKFQPLVDKMLKGEETIVSNAVFEGQKQMEKWTKEIANNTAISNITNNRNVQQPVVHQQFNITMPNVTDSTSAASLMNDLQSLATKKYQVDW